MAIRTSFTAGEVLAAADLTDTFNSKPKKTTASSAPGSPATGDLWFDTTTTPATPKFWSGSAWQTFSAGAANFSNTATGTYSTGGVNYKYVTFTASGTLTVTTAGMATVLVVGSGGGGGVATIVRAGGGGGGFDERDIVLTAGTKTVTVGAGGGAYADGNKSEIVSNLTCGGGGRGVAYNSNPSVFGIVTPASGGNGAGGAAAMHVGGVSFGVSGLGCGGTVFGANAQAGRVSTITNSSVTYGAGGQGDSGGVGSANTGNGGGNGANAGGSGVVIIRVKV